MRNALIAAVAAVALLAGCTESADNQAGNAGAPKNTQILPITDNHAAVVVRAPANKQAALKLMHERHEGMEKIGDASKLLGRQVKASSPDLKVIRSSAATIASLAPKVSSWFPPGTGPDVGKTRAQPAIWKEPQDYAAKTRAFQSAARAFNSAARSGDMTAIKARHGTLAKTCKGCHDRYRAEKH